MLVVLIVSNLVWLVFELGRIALLPLGNEVGRWCIATGGSERVSSVFDTNCIQQLDFYQVSWSKTNLTCFLANNAAAIIDGQQEICRAVSSRLTAITINFVTPTRNTASIESKHQSSMLESSAGA
jgi:hypothetical protein